MAAWPPYAEREPRKRQLVELSHMRRWGGLNAPRPLGRSGEGGDPNQHPRRLDRRLASKTRRWSIDGQSRPSAYAIREVDCAPLFPVRDSVIPNSPLGTPTLQDMVSPDNAANARRLRDGAPILDRGHGDDELDADTQQPYSGA